MAEVSPPYPMQTLGESSTSQSGFAHMTQTPTQHGYMPYPAYPIQPQHMQGNPYNYPMPGGSYLPMPSNEFAYATPSRQPLQSHPSMPPMTYNGTTPQHASGTTMLGRPVDGPMSLPPHQGQPSMWTNHANDETPTRQTATVSRKGRPKKQPAVEGGIQGQAAVPSTTKTPKTKQKRLSVDSGESSSRAAKRTKKNHNPQLPTPPATGDAPAPFNADAASAWDAHRPSIDMQYEAMSMPDRTSTPVHPRSRRTSQVAPIPQQHAHRPSLDVQLDAVPYAETAPTHVSAVGRKMSQGTSGSVASSRLGITEEAHQPASVIRHTEEGRRLAFGPVVAEEGVTITYEPPVATGSLSPRYVSAPTLAANESGMVSVDTNDVLETEMAWLDDRPQTPRSNADELAILRTPIMSRDTFLTEDDRDTPMTKASKRAKRLSAFNATTPKPASSQWTTRIENMGRVAFTKGFATKFLGLTSDNATVEESSIGNMVETPPDASPSSLPAKKPDWPDAEAPWSTALNSWSTWIASDRKVKDRAAKLDWYVGDASDDSSDEEVVWGNPAADDAARRVPRPAARFNNMVYRQRTLPNWEAANDNATSALLLSLRNRPLRSIPDGVVACLCGSRDSGEGGGGTTIRCDSCQTWHHIRCYNMSEVPHGYHYAFFCDGCKNRAMAVSTPARTPRANGFHQSDERSSALKRQASDIALAPSPSFTSFNNAANNSRTPLGRAIASASSPSRAPRARMLSYDNDIPLQWSEFLHYPVAAPSTPVFRSGDRFSTPKIDDLPFDVTSTPSRHIDFNIGQPSLFSLTPLNGRSRIPSGMLTDHMTPFRGRNVSFGQPLTDMIPSRHGFLNDLGRGGNGSGPSAPSVPYSEGAVPASPSSTRWPHGHGLMGAPHVSPSPFGHRRTASGNKMSSLRSSSKAGLGYAMGNDGSVEEEEEEQ